MNNQSCEKCGAKENLSPLCFPPDYKPEFILCADKLRTAATILRLCASMLDFACSATGLSKSLEAFNDALSLIEEWDDVVLEDILDAEYIEG